MAHRPALKLLCLLLLVSLLAPPPAQVSAGVPAAPQPAGNAQFLPDPVIVTLTPTPNVAKIGDTLHAYAQVNSQTFSRYGFPITTNMTFKLYPPSDPTCAGSPVFTYTPPVWSVGNTFGTSYFNGPGYKPTVNGIYHWVGTFMGFGVNSSSCADGAVEVRSPTSSMTLHISLSATTVTVGDAVTVTAKIDNPNVNEGGQLNYNFYNDPILKCSGKKLYGPFTRFVTGGVVSPSPATTIDRWGSLWVNATYQSNFSPNIIIGSECLLLEVLPKNYPALTVTSVPAQPTIKDKLNAQATILFPDIGAIVQPSGTVTFSLYSGSTCSDADSLPVYQAAVSVNSAGTTFPYVSYSIFGTSSEFAPGGFVPPGPGFYSWRAFYTGDKNYGPKISDCVPVEVKNQATITLSFTPTSASVIGDTLVTTPPITAQAELVGLNPNYGGTLTYTLYEDSQCTVLSRQLNSQPVSPGGGPYLSSQTIFYQPGVTYWQAEYSGDANNNSAKSACVAYTTYRANPSISAQLPVTTVKMRGPSNPTSEPVTVSYSISGPWAAPTGSVEIWQMGTLTDASGWFYIPCAYWDKSLDSRPVTIFSVAGTSAPLVFDSPGVYGLMVIYKGDSRNNMAESECMVLTVTPYQMSLPMLTR